MTGEGRVSLFPWGFGRVLWLFGGCKSRSDTLSHIVLYCKEPLLLSWNLFFIPSILHMGAASRWGLAACATLDSAANQSILQVTLAEWLTRCPAN